MQISYFTGAGLSGVRFDLHRDMNVAGQGRIGDGGSRKGVHAAGADATDGLVVVQIDVRDVSDEAGTSPA